MSRSMRGLIIALALGAGGCRLGPKIEEIQAANSPAGVATKVVTGSSSYEGELLALGDDRLLLLVEDRLTVIPYGIIESVQPERLGHLDGDDLREKQSQKVERVILWTRYPQGVTVDLLQQLLRAYNQTKVVTVGS